MVVVVVVVVVVGGGGDMVELELEEEGGWWVLLLWLWLVVERWDLLFPLPIFGDFFWGEIFDLILQRVSSFLLILQRCFLF